MGPRTVPWGTPDETGASGDDTPSITTLMRLVQGKELIHLWSEPVKS